MSASWVVPSTAVSGVYIARLTRTDTGGASHIVFVVRNDASHSDLLMQTSDTTWQAYNTYGGTDFYVPASFNTQAYKVSYNRPVLTRDIAGGRDFLFSNEYPMIRFLERNGYDVSYISGVDTARYGSLLLNHKVFLSVGHDEYWSGQARANVQAARDAGVSLAFFSGNEIYWKTRWEPSTVGTLTDYRTLVCYKETWANAKIDPTSAWTGTWRDPRFSPPADGGYPENALTGTIYQANSPAGAFTVPYPYSLARIWRNTAVAATPVGGSTSLLASALGYEFDTDMDNGFRPAGLIDVSHTVAATQQKLIDYGSTVVPGTVTHSMTEYKAPSGALVFSAGTIQWAWGLDADHDGSSDPADPNMQQATVNVLADMGAQPATLASPGLVAASPTTDTTAPTAAITAPTSGASVQQSGTVTISGTAADVGGIVAGVEVSTDGGTSWHPANPGASGFGSWTYPWTPQAIGTVTLEARATDDSLNIGTPASTSVSVVGPKACPCSLFATSPIPFITAANDSSSIEVGVTFTSSVNGYVTGVRFYKGGTANGGTHVGRLWSSAGTLLASATFSNETNYGWQTVTFATPVPVTAGATYVASYFAPQGEYSVDQSFFSSAFVNSPLTATGSVYRYGTGGVLPTNTYNNENYWVDVVFGGSAVSDTTPPSVVSVSPGVGATGVSTASKVSVTLSEPIQSGASIVVVPQGGSAVAGSTALDGTGTVLTFTPSSAVAASTTFTATVSGVKDLAGNAMASYSWSFTTAAVGAVCPSSSPCTIFGSATPANAVASDSSSVELGVQFSSSVNGFVTGVRFYKGGTANGGTHVGRLWSASGTLLASATFSNETSSGWQTVTFSSPVAVTAGATYVASYYAPQGGYSYNSGFFASPFVNSPLTATQGVFRYGTGGVLPTNTYSNTSYWVDVVFSGSAVSDTTPPSVVSVSPGVGATGVSTASKVSVTLSEPIQSGASIVVVPQGGSAVAGSTALDGTGTVLTFTPSSALAASTTFTATVSGVKDLAGNAMASYSWSFTTAAVSDTTPPSVVSVSPGVGATGVSTASKVSVTLSEPIQSGASIVVVPQGGSAVAGSTALDGTGTVLTFTPSSAVAASTTFTATVSGVKDLAGNAMASYSWSFTTAAVGAVCPSSSPCTIFGSATPANAVASDSSSVELGVQFSSSVNGFVTGVRFYKGGTANGGTHVGRLWSASGTLLASATFSNETSSGWQTVTFSSPVAVTAGATYVASYYAPQGGYSYNSGFFASPFVNSPLTATQGVFRYGTGGVLPTNTYSNTSYWVDVVFSGSAVSDTTPPSVVSVSPGVGATGVSTASKVSVTLSEPIQSGASIVVVPQGGSAVAGSTALDGTGTVLTFTPSSALAASTTFTATVSGVKDLAGNAMASYSWSFTTAAVSDTTPPSVVSVSPGVGATGVSTASKVSVTLSEPIQSGASIVVVPQGGSAVAGSTALDGTGTVLTFTPSSALAASTTFTATVSGVKDLAGNAMASYSWSFTTAAVGAVCPSSSPCTIFGSATPANAVASDSSSVELGVQFSSSVNGFVTGVRFYKGGTANGGTHVGRLWSASGTLLASATFSNETSSGWQTVTFSSPVAVTAGATYVASYYAPQGGYSYNSGFFASPFVNSPLTATQGVFRYGTGGVLPTNTYSNTSYWVDVVFSVS